MSARVVLVLRVDVTHLDPAQREYLMYALSAQCEGEDADHGYYPPAPGCDVAFEREAPAPAGDALALEVSGGSVEIVSSIAGPDDDE